MKRRILTRILSAFMAAILVVELLPAPAFASDADLPEEDISADAPLGDTTSEEIPAVPEESSDPIETDIDTEQSSEEDPPDEDPSSDEAEEPQRPEEDPSDVDTPSDHGDFQSNEELPGEDAPLTSEEREDPENDEVSEQDTETPKEDEEPPKEDGELRDEETADNETADEETADDETADEEDALSEEEVEGLRQQAIMDELDQLLISLNSSRRRAPAKASFEDQLAQFPDSYQPALKALHATHPNWTFVAVDTGLDWNAAVNAEYGSRSTMEYNYGPGNVANHLLLNNHNTYYSSGSYSSTNHYRPIDGRFVSASRAAIAYYMDPRNFLDDKYIFQFEDQQFNNSVEKSGVSTILLSGCNTSTGLAKITTYVTTAGKTKSLSELSSVYGEDYPTVIYNIGKVTNVSPYFLASKIVQETSANTTSSVISGTVSGYVGYYNFYNIGSTADASGKAYINGLKYAKNHDWFNPIVALKGGAEFLADKYISKGQNTAYYMRFNVSPDRYYTAYAHQYMSALPASAAEGSKTATGYRTIGAMNSAFLFYIPIYKNMPDQTATVNLTPTTKGKTTSKVTLYKEPSISGSYLTSVPSGTDVTILGGTVTSTDGYQNRIYYPYWYQVKVTVSGKSYTGYIYEQAISVNSVYNLKKGSTKSIKTVLSTTGNVGTIYYETSDPAVATVSDSGVVTAIANGSCTIYAISGGGSFDAIGITVSSSGATSVAIDEPALTSISNTTGGIKIGWKAVSGATLYRVYRKTADSNWSRIAEVTTTSFTDGTAKSGTSYTYTVRALSGSVISTYDETGLSVRFLKAPSLLSATATSNGITVKWGETPGANGYNIYRKVTGGSWERIATVSSSSTSFLDCERMVSGTTYIYTVRAYYGSGLSSFYANGISAKATLSSLTAPKLKSISNTSNGIRITWDAVSGAQSYRVYRKTGNSGWSRVAVGSATSFTDTAVANDTVYTYTVRAESGSKLSGYDASGLTYRYLKPPSLASAKASANSITVTWKQVPGAQGYYVYRKVSGGNWSFIKTISSGSTVSYTDNGGLVSGTTYIYTVLAYSDRYRSSFVSAGVSAKASSAYQINLATPTLKAISNTLSGVTASWNPVSGAEKYRVYRKTSNTNWVNLADVTSTSYADTTTVSGTTYYYTVRALAGNTQSGYNAAGLSICYLKAPSLTSAVASSNSITVKWEKVSGAHGYQVYRRTTGSNWARIANISSGSTVSYTDNSVLVSGTTYYYTVRSVYGSYLSSYFNSGISAKISSGSSNSNLKNYIANGKLNYRTGPGFDYSIAGSVASRTTVQVVSDSDVNVNGSIWYKVYINGKYYYMLSDYLRPAGTSTSSLGTPTLKSISNAVNGVTVTWSAISGAQNYRIYRKTSGTNWNKIADVKTVSYTDTSAISGTTYFYTVRAVSGSSISGYNTSGLSICYLKTPTLTSASAASSGITVKWEKISGAKGYYIYRKTSGSGWSRVGQVNSGSTVSYLDNSSLTSSATYIYTVRAYSGSSLSSFVSTGVSAKAVSNSNLINYVTTGMLNYRTGPGSNYSLAGTLDEGKTVQVVSGSGVDVNGTIWYKIYYNGSYYYMSSKFLKKV